MLWGVMHLQINYFLFTKFWPYTLLCLYSKIGTSWLWLCVCLCLGCSGGAAHVIKQFSQILFCFFSRSKLFLSWFICCLSKTGGPANYAYKLWSSENHQIKTSNCRDFKMWLNISRKVSSKIFEIFRQNSTLNLHVVNLHCKIFEFLWQKS